MATLMLLQNPGPAWTTPRGKPCRASAPRRSARTILLARRRRFAPPWRGRVAPFFEQLVLCGRFSAVADRSVRRPTPIRAVSFTRIRRLGSGNHPRPPAVPSLATLSSPEMLVITRLYVLRRRSGPRDSARKAPCPEKPASVNLDHNGGP